MPKFARLPLALSFPLYAIFATHIGSFASLADAILPLSFQRCCVLSLLTTHMGL